MKAALKNGAGRDYRVNFTFIYMKNDKETVEALLDRVGLLECEILMKNALLEHLAPSPDPKPSSKEAPYLSPNRDL